MKSANHSTTTFDECEKWKNKKTCVGLSVRLSELISIKLNTEVTSTLQVVGRILFIKVQCNPYFTGSSCQCSSLCNVVLDLILTSHLSWQTSTLTLGTKAALLLRAVQSRMCWRRDWLDGKWERMQSIALPTDNDQLLRNTVCNGVNRPANKY
jgi:hypothetical protein